MEVEEGWLETILKRNRRDKEVQRILSVACSPAVGEGENFASVLIRVKMRVVLGSGKIANRSVIIKRIPQLDSHIAFLEEYEVFKTEIKVYSQILPKFEDLMLNHNDTSNHLWCSAIFCKKQEEIVMEDLKESGYRIAERKEGLDLNQALLVVRSLARFHAMSCILMDREELDKNSLLEYSMARGKPLMSCFMEVGLTTLARVIKENWGDKWEAVSKKIDKFSKIVPKKIKKLCEEEHKVLLVLNHGDCWTNNFMFKFELGIPYPSAMRFVDFQESHFNSCGWDLTFLFYTSLHPNLRSEMSDVILGEYRKALGATLEYYGHIPERLPDLEELKSEMKRLVPYGLMISGSILPFLAADKENMMDMEAILDLESQESAQARFKLFSAEKYTEWVQSDIEYLLEYTDM